MARSARWKKNKRERKNSNGKKHVPFFMYAIPSFFWWVWKAHFERWRSKMNRHKTLVFIFFAMRPIAGYSWLFFILHLCKLYYSAIHTFPRFVRACVSPFSTGIDRELSSSVYFNTLQRKGRKVASFILCSGQRRVPELCVHWVNQLEERLQSTRKEYYSCGGRIYSIGSSFFVEWNRVKIIFSLRYTFFSNQYVHQKVLSPSFICQDKSNIGWPESACQKLRVSETGSVINEKCYNLKVSEVEVVRNMETSHIVKDLLEIFFCTLHTMKLEIVGQNYPLYLIDKNLLAQAQLTFWNFWTF